MAASRAAVGLGTEFFIGQGSPITYTSVTEAASISFADFTVDEIDVTHLLSPGDYAETIAGRKVPGSATVSGNYVGDAAQQLIDTLAQARTVFPFKITSPLSGARTLTVLGTGFINSRETGPFTPSAVTQFKFGMKIAGSLSYAVA
jgi:predicted secreted protein